MHPYSVQPKKAFWRRVVEEAHPLSIDSWYEKKFSISDQTIAAAGSCFAQHIGHALRSSGFRFLDFEPAPSFLPADARLEFGYGMYSARYGNVYTSRQLVQLARRALGDFEHRGAHIWTKGDGFVDAFRPTIEPAPFRTVDELVTLRASHLAAVLELFQATDVFIFTLGLTEAWLLKEDGAAFPVCPGTAGGAFDPDLHVFRNLDYREILDDMEQFFDIMRAINPAMKFILTVSPVPLMATATQHNVVVASSYSKAVLRAVAGDLAARHDWVDYFPSFDIISSIPMRSMFYNPDLRTVVADGVSHVMKSFFSQHEKPVQQDSKVSALEPDCDDVKCDEELLDAFGGGN